MNSENMERVFWTEKMEAAYAFMEKMRTYPLEENGEPMVSMQDAADGLEVQFSSDLRNGKYPRAYFLREGLISKFLAVASAANACGWILKVEDAYRSPEMQSMQVHNQSLFDIILQKIMWELQGELPAPEFVLRRFSAIIATRSRIGTHVSGSAIDIINLLA